MDFSEEELYRFAAGSSVYYSMVITVTCFAFPEEILAADVVVVLFKAFLLDPSDEENDLSTASGTKNSFRYGFMTCKPPFARKPRTVILLPNFDT